MVTPKPMRSIQNFHRSRAN